MAIEKYLKDLETEEFEARQLLGSIITKKNEYLLKFPWVHIYAWEGWGPYENGDHVINAPTEKVKPISKIKVTSEGNFVLFKSGERKKLEDYFTEDEIDSIRKV